MKNSKINFLLGVILILNSCGFSDDVNDVADVITSVKSIASVTAFTIISIP